MALLFLTEPSPKLILPNLVSEKMLVNTLLVSFHVLLSKSGFIMALTFIPINCLPLSSPGIIEGQRKETFSKAAVLN